MPDQVEVPGFWRNNGLSIVLVVLFLGAFGGQSVAGHRHYNDEQEEHGQPQVTYPAYIASPAFLEVTMENWESEFLQMAAYVLLTALFFQKGSAESKDPGKQEPVDRAPDPSRPGAPGPVRRGGLALVLYRNSLSLAFAALFLLSIFLRQQGSPESKPVDAAHTDTGTE